MGDRRRSYADGVSLFRRLARPQVRERYGAFIEGGIGKVTDTSDGRFTLLVNLLSRIRQDIPLQPSLYPAAFEVATMAPKTVKSATSGNMQTVHLDTGLQNQVDDLEGRINEHDNAIDDLRGQVDELYKPGVKVVTEASMPPHIRECYDRVKEIAPLYGSLHADICRTDITDEERRKLAESLCDLDDERRRLWKRIDEWSEGRKLEVETEHPRYSEDPVVRGFEYARAVKRLKENIRNSRTAAEKAKQDGRTVVYENAMRRIEGYEKELKEIQEKMSAS